MSQFFEIRICLIIVLERSSLSFLIRNNGLARNFGSSPVVTLPFVRLYHKQRPDLNHCSRSPRLTLYFISILSLNFWVEICACSGNITGNKIIIQCLRQLKLLASFFKKSTPSKERRRSSAESLRYGSSNRVCRDFSSSPAAGSPPEAMRDSPLFTKTREAASSSTGLYHKTIIQKRYHALQ